MNAVHKMDCYCYGMFGFLACKDNYISPNPNPEFSLRIFHVPLTKPPPQYVLFKQWDYACFTWEAKVYQPLAIRKTEDEAVGMASSVDTFYQFLSRLKKNMTVSTTLPSYEYMRSNYIPTVALMIMWENITLNTPSSSKPASEHLVFNIVFR